MTCSAGISNLRLCYHVRINLVITRQLKLKEGLSTTFPGSGPLPGCVGLAAYFLSSTQHAPNNKSLPVLHYKNVLPQPLTEENVTAFMTAHKWEKRGTWGHIPIRHFHPNSHECYGIFSGNSTIVLGIGGGDEDGGVRVQVHAGDVIVLPAGTAHSMADSSGDYRYIGVYPEGSPRWRNEIGEKPIDPNQLMKEIESVAKPQEDPVYGQNGPMVKLWNLRERPRL